MLISQQMESICNFLQNPTILQLLNMNIDRLMISSCHVNLFNYGARFGFMKPDLTYYLVQFRFMLIRLG